ncbi:hypothetical protein GCK32_001821 [Trichostrongylus colubriformis]|uniref:Uncharacterized protein n=1 Tax=Trichostrongylus colubriformis TaxID=6319 RepID=A0AAN8ILN6_TRICO
MLSDVHLHKLVIEPIRPPPAEHTESSTMTDPLQVREVETDPMERRSVAVGTEADEERVTAEGVTITEETIALVESLLRDSLNSHKIFNRLEPFHKSSLIQLQPIRSATVTPLSAETLPVCSLSCGSAGRTAVLIGESEHDTWCSHAGKVIIAQRSKSSSIPLAVCPSASAWSSQGMLAVGDVAGDVHLIINDAVLGTLKVHSQAVSALDWISQSQIVSCGADGLITIIHLKGTSLEVDKSLRLAVTDLPRKIRKSSSSAKSLSVVAMSRSGAEVCIASETGGLWIVSIPDLRLKTIVNEPQAVQSILYLSSFVVLCGDPESTTLLLNDGSFADTLPIGAMHQCKVDEELLVIADGTQILIYDVSTRSVMLNEKRPMRSMNVSPQGDLIILNDNELVTYRLMKSNA